MHRAIAFALVAAAAVAASGAEAAGGGPSSSTSLRIDYWPKGPRGEVHAIWTLRCNPARGTLRKARVACRRLNAGGAELFAPVPPDAACSQVVIGPESARVVGTVAGRRIWVRLGRWDSCQDTRWRRLSPWLLPSGS